MGSLPGAEEREADLAALVQVRVEPDDATPGGAEVDHRRAVRVLDREVNVKLVAAARVGSVFGSEIKYIHWEVAGSMHRKLDKPFNCRQKSFGFIQK